mmetsp:Transcript_125924/g.356120  ORF Transcript_125924/g.356120 Transcript_125924/m.356120 type:complete len:285 (+) Transcript_125924:509-1363(+)
MSFPVLVEHLASRAGGPGPGSAALLALDPPPGAPWLQPRPPRHCPSSQAAPRSLPLARGCSGGGDGCASGCGLITTGAERLLLSDAGGGERDLRGGAAADLARQGCLGLACDRARGPSPAAVVPLSVCSSRPMSDSQLSSQATSRRESARRPASSPFPSFLWSMSRQLKSVRTSPFQSSSLQARFSSWKDSVPPPSRSRALNASSTEPKFTSAHVLKDSSSSKLFSSYSRMLMEPEKSRSSQRQAPTKLPWNCKLPHAVLNSDQETEFELSLSRMQRHARSGWS